MSGPSVGACHTCGLTEQWSTEMAAGCAMTWHIYEHHLPIWEDMFGADRPPRDRRPEEVGERLDDVAVCCPECHQPARLILGPTQALCGNEDSCNVLMFNPSESDGGAAHVHYLDLSFLDADPKERA